MARDANYTIPIKDLDERLDGSLKLIRDAARQYHLLMKKKLKKSRKSGALINSWKFELYNETTAAIYSNLPYARIQDKSGKIKITAKMRNFFWYKYGKTKDKMWKAMAITKKKYISIPAKNYSNVSTKQVAKYVQKRNPIKK